MPKSADGQYEMVLENRQVLTMFFVIVVLCGVFFGLGYTVGKNTVGYIPPAQADLVSAAGKKSAIVQAASAESGRQEPSSQAAAPPASELTYDKSLAAKAPSPTLETQPAAPPAAEPRPAAVAAPAPPLAAEGTISLQVAALSKKEDAEALLSLLNKKGFRAYSVTNQADRLFRVQVGPFSTPKDAEEMKLRLEQEGFKAITRK